MRTFFICIIFLVARSYNAQSKQNLTDLNTFFKVSIKDIRNCQKESKGLRKEKTDPFTVKSIYDQCIARYEHLNFYKDNTLKIMERVPNNKDFLIINYIYDNVMTPHSTKTIINFDNHYYGLKHYYIYENEKFIEKNEEFEISNSDLTNIENITEYLRTGKSIYISNKKTNLVGNNTHWYVVEKIGDKLQTLQLFTAQ
ncbi:hypothetical protein [Chryseobacterium sp. JUb7]|uniref:hypothetical protein n=1 Tax=Chryseobacterium sp. JUb7 TaxID=2940599 RepID=UPI002169C508|nr:hypothetical protein [Chryseobacterium sp. JUb7]MCS3533068.1 hypothetical protein [Chryseobacterium sp. JUb7]